MPTTDPVKLKAKRARYRAKHPEVKKRNDAAYHMRHRQARNARKRILYRERHTPDMW